MTNQQVACMYGKANLRDCLVTYGSFVITPPFTRTTAVTPQVKKSQVATAVGTSEHNGVLLNCTVEHPVGTVIMLTSRWMQGMVTIREANLFFRLREGATLWQVIATVPTGPQNVCGNSAVAFTGHADILNEQKLNELGVHPYIGFMKRFMNAEEVRECFRLNKLAEEVVAKPSVMEVITPKGVEKKEIAQAPKRRMFIGRK